MAEHCLTCASKLADAMAAMRRLHRVLCKKADEPPQGMPAAATRNALVSKRFAKRQQMQWTRRGAHLLLQTRIHALDGTLQPLFDQRHPGLASDNPASAGQAAAA